jgi:hypothetical protein
VSKWISDKCKILFGCYTVLDGFCAFGLYRLSRPAVYNAMDLLSEVHLFIEWFAHADISTHSLWTEDSFPYAVQNNRRKLFTDGRTQILIFR